MVAAVFALDAQHLPCPPLQQQIQGNPCRRAGPAGCREGERGSTGPSAGICTRFPPPSPKGTPRLHAVLHGLGMTHRSTSPLVSISFSFPVSTEASTVYLLPLLPAIVFAVCGISSCIQGRESSAARAAFKGVVRSVLPRDGAAVQELTFRVFTSDLPHAVIISHATKTISWNDSGPMASTVAAEIPLKIVILRETSDI